MSSVGPYLRELRERRGLSLDEIARVTRVPRRYLEALEADEADVLPPAVFTKGYIRAYCQAVQQPPEEALALYMPSRETASSQPPVPDVVPSTAPMPAAAPTPPRRIVDREIRSRGPVLVSFILLIILGVALFVVTLSLQPGSRRMERRADTGQGGTVSSELDTGGRDAATKGAEVARVPEAPRPFSTQVPARPDRGVTKPEVPRAVTPGATPTPPAPGVSAVKPPSAPREPGSAAPESSGAAASGAQGASEPRRPLQAATEGAPSEAQALPGLAIGPVTAPFRLVARTSEPTWVRVRTEDGAMTEETIPAGGIREWASDRPFTVTLGNAGGITLELNGQRLPRLGPSGAVVRGLVLPPRAQ